MASLTHFRKGDALRNPPAADLQQPLQISLPLFKGCLLLLLSDFPLI
jgi:hypothetical protein